MSDQETPIQLDTYDAGLLGGNREMSVEWWHDYIRHELGCAHQFYQEQLDALAAKHPEKTPVLVHISTGRRFSWIVDVKPRFEKDVELPICDQCNGNGKGMSGWGVELIEEECPKCFGRGRLPHNLPDVGIPSGLVEHLQREADKWVDKHLPLKEKQNDQGNPACPQKA